MFCNNLFPFVKPFLVFSFELSYLLETFKLSWLFSLSNFVSLGLRGDLARLILVDLCSARLSSFSNLIDVERYVVWWAFDREWVSLNIERLLSDSRSLFDGGGLEDFRGSNGCVISPAMVWLVEACLLLSSASDMKGST
jgi:hypothetical protein